MNNEQIDVAELLRHFHDLVQKGAELRRSTRTHLERARAIVQRARRLHLGEQAEREEVASARRP